MLLGLGQTAQVYLARGPRGEKVALKIPKKEVRENPRLAERFAREVAFSLSLRHPHLVRGLWGLPFGEEAFLALEYLPGGTLEERLLKGAFPQEEAVKVLSQVGEALLFLHGKGLLHQDVKPSNVFVGEGVYKLGDLGTLRAKEDRSPEYAGSPPYLAPELFLGGLPSEKSEAYSFGVMAYELLTGRRPFLGETLEDLRNAHLLLPPPPTRLPPRLDRALRRLLAKNPEERMTIREFLDVLQNPEGPPAQGTPERPRRFPLFRRK
ncbi:serine/threonine protein kinase [Thermus arciformis]|uniref:Serine/threonine protein kinase n=1 Tax=Thermus arciformis TaxID=482827 RepID=A0A1G7E3P8_9DEIN|nr:serine/threonine-protein kinase [Thermus arciformis]SDE58229.1 serine/threonine protein kinase [Thermus arciformis]